MKLVVPTTSFPRYAGDISGHFILSLLREQCAHRPEMETLVIAPDCGDASRGSVDCGPRIRVQQFRYLPEARHQTLVYGGGIMPNLKSNPLRLWQVPFFLGGFQRAILKVLPGADLVHANWSISGWCALPCLRRGVPLVVTLHGSDFSGAGGRVVDWMTRRVLRRASGVICVNERLRLRVLESGIDADRVITIRNGIDTAEFAQSRDRAILTGTGIERCDPVILFLGRLAEVKGPDRALSVFETFLRHHPGAGLLMVGDGALGDGLKRRVAASPTLQGRVYWAGLQPTEKIPAYFAASDALLISSRNEGLPTSVLESLAAGVPVVTVPVGGVPEVIHDGETGFCAGANTDEALVETLRRCFADKAGRDRAVAKGRALVERELTWDRVAQRHLDFYARVMELESGGPPTGE